MATGHRHLLLTVIVNSPNSNMTSITPQTRKWSDFYGSGYRTSVGRYPTEWVVRTLAGGNYPSLKMDKSSYRDARILDMGCGDGRNLSLLLDLGFEVHACELNSEMVHALEAYASRANWAVQFKVGTNHQLPYSGAYFDYVLCCASCYYLDDSITWSQVRTELARVLKPGGILVANFCDDQNFLLKNAIQQADGSLLITSDPYNLRNGIRFVAASSEAEVLHLISPDFNLKGLAHLRDDFYGIHVSGPVVVAQKV